MGTGWRRAFCNTLPRDRRDSAAGGGGGTTASAPTTPRLGGSNPPTPRLRCKTFCHRSNSRNSENDLDTSSPKLECKTTPKSRRSSNPSSPRSPFSILKNTLRLSRNNCGVCMQSVKRGQGMAIYTAECSHAFHFPCIASHVRKQGSLLCPVCNTTWKDVPLLASHTNNQNHHKNEEEEEKIVKIDCSSKRTTPVSSPKLVAKQCDLKSYSDDEPLVTPKAGAAKFVPILEDNDEETEEVEEFQGFFVNPISSSDDAFNRDSRGVEVSLSPDAAVISQGREYNTYAVVLKVKAPPPPQVRDVSSRRAPIDLVTVLDISGSMTGAKLEMLKRAMRLVISSLGSADRLSIVAFAAAPKRLLPMRRMTPQGQRAARRIIDRLTCSHGGSSMAEALRQATRVLEERRERNPVASIILLSDGQDDAVPASNNNHQQRRGSSQPSSTRFAHVEIPVHSPRREHSEDAFSKCVGGLLSVVVQDLRIQLGLAPGSDPAEITAVYTCSECAFLVGSGSIRVGDLYAEEEKEFLVEIRVPATRIGSHHVISAKCSYKDPASEELVCGGEQALLVPQPQPVRSGSVRIERLRNCFICSRAVAESRRLIEHEELSSAMQLLSSARALLIQSRSESGVEYIRCLEAEMSEVQWRRQLMQRRRTTEGGEVGVFLDENGEPLTPKSAWRAADKLAKVAQMKKSFDRVSSDLHGFENARF